MKLTKLQYTIRKNKAERAKQAKLEKDRAKRFKTELKQIYQILIAPALSWMPANLDTQDWLTSIWGNVDIYAVKSKKTFEIGGQLMLAPKVGMYGSTNNTIQRNSRAWIRQDHDFPDKHGVDIELEDGRWFKLTVAQFNEIKYNFVREQ